MTRYQPMQPIEEDEHGIIRFRGNQVVQYLLDHGGIDMNHLATVKFDRADRDQFYQLINYSVSAAPISEDLKDTAIALCEAGESVETDRMRAIVAEEKLAMFREKVAPAIAELFQIHPDDLAT